jgi:hypothetical protein
VRIEVFEVAGLETPYFWGFRLYENDIEKDSITRRSFIL